jgi:predicted site-specific integrase-resolvase
MSEQFLVEPLLDGHQIAQILGVKIYTVARMRRAGEIPSIAYGPRRHRYRVSEVLRALGKLPAKEEEATTE